MYTPLLNYTTSRLLNASLTDAKGYYSSQNDSLMAQRNVRQPRFSHSSPLTMRLAVGSFAQENMNNYNCGERNPMTHLAELFPEMKSIKALMRSSTHPSPSLTSIQDGGGAISLLASNVYLVANGKLET